MWMLLGLACGGPAAAPSVPAPVGGSGSGAGSTAHSGGHTGTPSTPPAFCVWSSDADLGASRYDPDGAWLDGSDCAFVAMDPDGRAYRDAERGFEIVDPATCGVQASDTFEDLYFCSSDFSPDSGESGYWSEPTLSGAAFPADGSAVLAYAFDRCNAWYYLQISAVDRLDGATWTHLYRHQEDPPTDVAVAGDVVLVVRRGGVALAGDPADVRPFPYRAPGPAELARAGEGDLGVPLRAEVGPDGALYVLDDAGLVIRYDLSTGAATVHARGDVGSTDLLFLPDDRLLLATPVDIDAFDAATGAALGPFTTAGGGERLGLGTCP